MGPGVRRLHDLHGRPRGGRHAAPVRWTPILIAMVAAGCGSSAKPEPPAATLTGAQAHAPAPETAGALARIADGPEARRRLGYVDPDRLANAGLPVREVALSVLGTAIDAPAIRVGNEVSAITDGPPPQTSAITPAAPSAVQSCLGNAVAQTILGMGDDAAIGAGLADSGDGLQLRICGAPHYIRHIGVMERNLERLGADARKVEIGEREIVEGVIDADALPPRQVLRLLAGGTDLRRLASRPRTRSRVSRRERWLPPARTV